MEVLHFLGQTMWFAFNDTAECLSKTQLGIMEVNKPRGIWKSEEPQKKFFDSLFIKLGYKCMDDWYKVTQEDIHKYGGAILHNYYNGSPSLALQGVYPEHNWELDRSKNKPR